MISCCNSIRLSTITIKKPSDNTEGFFYRSCIYHLALFNTRDVKDEFTYIR